MTEVVIPRFAGVVDHVDGGSGGGGEAVRRWRRHG